jgi:hypothetical protein
MAEPRYFEDENGNIVTVPEEELGNYNIVPYQAESSDSTLKDALDYAAAIGQGTYDFLERPVTGGVTALEDIFSTGTNYGKNARKTLDRQRLESLSEANVAPGSWGETGVNVASGAIPLIGSAVSGIGLPALIAAFTAQGGLDKYGELRDRDVDPVPAAAGGTVQGLVSGGTAALPISRLMKPARGGMYGLDKGIETAIANLLQGAVGFLVTRNGYYRIGRVGRGKVRVVFSNKC